MGMFKPTPAATIVLLRDRDGHIDFFLQQRHRKTDFGAVYVFPGGKVSAGDSVLKQDYHVSGLTPEEADRKLNIDSNGMDYWITAVRECFEEAGFLLADNEKGEPISFSDRNINSRFQDYREKINAKQMTFFEMCRAERLTLPLDRMLPCAHWITPIGSPYRYDTRFFIARAPAGQEGCHDNQEAVNSLWLTPQEAVRGYRHGDFPMILPTIDMVESLTSFACVDDALAYYADYQTGRARSFF